MSPAPTASRRSRLALVLALAAVAALAVPALAAQDATAAAPPRAPLDARIDLRFAPATGGRTQVRGVVAVPVDQVQRNSYGFYNLELEGEVLVEGRVYDHFSYRFDVPTGTAATTAPLALSFARTLRPGSFRLIVEVRDLQSGRAGRLAQALEVPKEQLADAVAPSSAAADAAGTAGGAPGAALATSPSGAPAATSATSAGPQVKLLPPPDVVTGKQRFAVDVTGPGVSSVRFLLDGRAVFQRTAPPYTVELDLGRHALPRLLRVEGLDATGRVVASDQAHLNAGARPFAVRLARQADAERSGVVLARADVQAPPDARVEKVELFVDDRPVGVLTRPPFQQQVTAPPDAPAVLRAVAHLADGSTAEDAVLLNAPQADEVHVDLVELYTAVVDRGGRPVRGLPASTFRVLEDGSPQRLTRFAEVADLPVHALLAIDTSTSMTLRMPAVKQAALAFLRDLVRPQDEAMLLTFDNAPHVRTDFTHDLAFLANGLEGLRASGGTALYDSLIFALQQLEDVKGQRVLVLLSDGVDERSRSTVREVMELARRSAVTIYTIGIRDPRPEAPLLDVKLLKELAEQTGGRWFFTDDTKQLAGVYGEIQKDMRSRYLLAYYSSHAGSHEFRTVDVKLGEPRLQARTIRGYYPD